MAAKKDHQTPAGSAGRTFYECLDFHMKFGTRPDGDAERPGVEWTAKELAEACNRDDRTVRNWRSGRTVPGADEVSDIADALFGDNPALVAWKTEFRTARREKKRSIPAQAEASESTQSKPHNLPFASLGARFMGRERDLERLHAALSAPARVAVVAGRAVHGLGGVGKTRLAVEYAFHHEADYSALVFLPAANPDELGAALARLCAPDMFDLPEQSDQNEERRKAAALHWLESHPTWLMIMDNVDDPTALAAVEKLRPRLRGGRLLITGRMASWPAGLQTLDLDVLDRDAAAAYLLEASGARGNADDAATAAELAEHLGGLALALEIAAAFVRTQPGMTLRRYLSLWTGERKRMATRIDRSLVHFEHHADLATVWSASVERLSPEARRLLELLSFLAPEPIPDALFDLPAPGEAEGHDGRSALKELIDASLAGRAVLADLPAYVVHRLVQEVTRECMNAAQQAETAFAAALWLYPPFFHGVDDFHLLATARPFVSHADAATTHALESQLPDNAEWVRATGVMIAVLGDVYKVQGSVVSAVTRYRAAGLAFEQLAARDPANTEWQRDLSISHNKIGDVELRLGNGDGALAAYRKSLAIREALGLRDPANTEWQRDLSVSHNKIGNVELRLGNGDAALAAYRKALAIADALALRDPANMQWQRDLSISHDRIGDVELRLGNGDAALAAYRKSLAIREALGLRDPANTQWQRDLSVSHEKIGDVELRLGNGDAALVAYRKGLAIREALGLRDPANTEWQRDLSVSHNKIGDVELRLGNGDAALAAYRKDLAIAEALALRDPANTEWQRDLSISHNKIGDVELRLGNGDAALAVYRKALAIAEALGLRDPANTEWQRGLSVSHNNVGDVELRLGNGDAALAAYRKALAIADALAIRDPANTEWQRDLIVSHVKLSESGSDARHHLKAGLAVATRLFGEGRLAPVDAWMVEDLRQRLAALG